jgi:hypothetical protein
MKRVTNIIQQQSCGDNHPGELTALSLNGLLDLLDALQPKLEAEGGLVSVFSLAL